MKTLKKTCQTPVRYTRKQGGVVLFIALIALVTIMLAAVSLLRSSDTSAVIAGNLAFKQAATVSGDRGVENAAAWLVQTANSVGNVGKNPFTDISHTFNVTNAAAGYYSNVDPTLDLKADTTWANAASLPGVYDSSQNGVRYIIQRMCRTANALLSESDCLFSDAQADDNSHNSGGQVPEKSGKNPLNRVTIKVAGPRNTVSYIQAFIY